MSLESKCSIVSRLTNVLIFSVKSVTSILRKVDLLDENSFDAHSILSASLSIPITFEISGLLDKRYVPYPQPQAKSKTRP